MPTEFYVQVTEDKVQEFVTFLRDRQLHFGAIISPFDVIETIEEGCGRLIMDDSVSKDFSFSSGDLYNNQREHLLKEIVREVTDICGGSLSDRTLSVDGNTLSLTTNEKKEANYYGCATEHYCIVLDRGSNEVTVEMLQGDHYKLVPLLASKLKQ